MALTRIYKYQIRKGAEKKYLKLQEEVLQLYRKHAEVEALFLHDLKNSAARTEVIRFFGPTPQADIQKIDADPEILNLFGLFQSEILDPEHPEIHEETLLSETLSSEKAESRAGGAMSDYTRFAILLNTVSGASTTEKLIRAHVEFLRKLDREKKLVMCGPFTDFKGGMVIVKAANIGEAIRIAQSDPFVIEGVRTFEVRTWELSCEENNHMGMG